MHENIANNTQVNQIYELLLPVVYCTRIFVVVFVVRSLAHSSSFFVGVVCVCVYYVEMFYECVFIER